jgi:hypothetical protein
MLFWIYDNSGILVSHDADVLSRKGSVLRSEPRTQISQSTDSLKIKEWLTEIGTRCEIVKAPNQKAIVKLHTDIFSLGKKNNAGW